MKRGRRKKGRRERGRENKEKMRLKAVMNQSGGNIRSAVAYVPS